MIIILRSIGHGEDKKKLPSSLAMLSALHEFFVRIRITSGCFGIVGEDSGEEERRCDGF